MAKKETPSTKAEGVGAGNVTRTRDLLITNQLLYQLSYSSLFSLAHSKPVSAATRNILSQKAASVNRSGFFSCLFRVDLKKQRLNVCFCS